MVLLHVQQGSRLQVLERDDSFRSLVIMASALAMMCYQQSTGPERAQDALGACLAIPCETPSHTLAIFKLKRRERPSCINGCQYAGSQVCFCLQNFSIVIGTVLLTNKGTHWPIAGWDEACLFVPGIVDQAISVGSLLPVIDLVARNTCLEDEIRIAPHRIEGVILYCCQPLHGSCQVG